MINIQTSAVNINNNLTYRHQAAISYASMFHISDNHVYLCLYTCFLCAWLSQKMAYLSWNM